MGGICLTIGDVQKVTSHFQKAMGIGKTALLISIPISPCTTTDCLRIRNVGKPIIWGIVTGVNCLWKNPCGVLRITPSITAKAIRAFLWFDLEPWHYINVNIKMYKSSKIIMYILPNFQFLYDPSIYKIFRISWSHVHDSELCLKWHLLQLHHKIQSHNH